jgi:predicted negative regulator of RcsB-dependent stress response
MQTDKPTTFSSRISKIKKELFIGAILLFVAGLALAMYQYLQHQKEYKAASAYFTLSQTWKNKEKPAENLKEEGNRNAIEAFVDSYKNTSTALSAAVLLADYYNAEKNNEKALAVLEKNSPSKADSFVSALYLYRKAIALEKLGKCDQAIKELEPVISSKKTSFITADARLQKALCLEQVGKKEEAKTEYEVISKDFSETEAGRNARKYLRLLSVGA